MTAFGVVTASAATLARRCVIDGPDGPEPWSLWPLQRDVLAALGGSSRVIILKARQLGVTWVLALWSLWWALVHPGQTVLVLSIGEREAKVVTRRVRRLYESLPEWVRAVRPLAVDTSERIELAHPDGPSAIVSLPSSGGRSETAHVLILDEGAHWEHTDERLGAVLPTAADAGRVVLVSTANGVGGEFWRLWSEAPGNGWRPVFVAADARPGRDGGWIARERANLGDLGPQEYPLSADEAFLATGRCAFDRADLAWYAEHSCAPAAWRGSLRRDDGIVHAIEESGGSWWVWSWPEPGRDYAIVADTSGGHGADYSAAVIVDLGSWDQVAAFHAMVEPSRLASELVKAGWMWRGPSGPALLVPEANNHGEAVIALLREWRYPRLYASEALDRDGSGSSRRYGWRTTDASRKIAVSSLQRALRDRTLGIRDPAAVAEMHRFIWVTTNEATGSGRYQADDGANDDRVMAWAITAAVLAHSEHVAPAMPAEPVAPYVPRVSGVTGY